MNFYVWVGHYESDIIDSKFFSNSITIYGSNCNGNYSFAEENHFLPLAYDDFYRYVIEKIFLLIQLNNCIKVVFYNEKWAYDIIRIQSSLSNYLFLGNDQSSFIDFLNNKVFSRNWLAGRVNIPPFIVGSKTDCNYQTLLETFHGYESFVIQEYFSEGGEGTWIIDHDNPTINDSLHNEVTYLISPFLCNAISLNVTLVLSNQKYTILPISEQILDKTLSFMGSDFVSGHQVYKKYSNIINTFVDRIADALLKNSYSGICGIDFLIYNNMAYFVEFNPRFQGSSFIINKFLNKKIHKSIYEVYMDAKNNILPYSKTEFTNEKIEYSWSKKKNNVIPTAILRDGALYKCARYIYSQKLSSLSLQNMSKTYYDFFASKYRYILPDYEESIKTEGAILSSIISKYSNRQVEKILDCTCGVGIQTISLAKLGKYSVFGSDISEKEIEIAKKETNSLKLNVSYEVSDCRKLQEVFPIKFDAIISIDSALNHLTDENSFMDALKSIYTQLEDGGIFLASFRDYDYMIKEKPEWAYPTRCNKTSAGNAIVLRHLEWESNICKSEQFYINIEQGKPPILFYSTYDQWAITRAELTNMAQRIFKTTFWLAAEETNFYQQIFCALK